MVIARTYFASSGKSLPVNPALRPQVAKAEMFGETVMNLPQLMLALQHRLG